jgi:glycosyltransferase involved in cell wall biosynthesis
LESIREWIEDDLNGLLIDPGDSTELAGAVIRALSDEALRTKGVEHNYRSVAEKATYVEVMAKAEAFYSRIRGRMTA